MFFTETFLLLMIGLFFGSPLFGLLEGLVRKRGAIGTKINVVVAIVFGWGTFGVLGFVLRYFGYAPESLLTTFLVFVLSPIAGAMIGIWLVLKYFRHERWPTLGEAALSVAGVPFAALLGLLSLGNTFGLIFGLAR